MSTPDTTPHYSLPLPHPGNDGVDDCLRLRQALQGVDAALKSVAEKVTTKADAADIALALEGFSDDIAIVMEQKADASAVNEALDLKADTVTVTASLALKADAAAVDSALEGVTAQLAKKSNAATVTAELAKKADTVAVQTELALKADAAANTADHNTLLDEISEAQAAITAVDAKAQQALDRDPLPSMTGAEGKFLTTNGTTARWEKLETLAVVNPPSVTIPAQFPIGFAQTMRMSATSRLTDGRIASFAVQAGHGEGTSVISVPATNNAADYSLTLSGNTGDLLPVTVVAVDASGYQSEPVTHNVVMVTASIAAPVFSGVTEGQTGVALRPAITAGAFAATPAGFDTPKAVDNFVYRFEKADGTLLEEGFKTFTSSGGVVQPANNLPFNAGVRLKGHWLGNKQRGEETIVNFTTTNALILAPVITGITEGQSNVPLVPKVTVGAFAASPAGVDTPKAADNFFYRFEKKDGSLIEQGYRTLPAAGGVVQPTNSLPLAADCRFRGHWLGVMLTGADTVVEFKTLQYTVPLGQTWLIRDSGTWVNPVPGGTYAIYAMGGGGGGAIAATTFQYRPLSAGGGGGSGYAAYQQKQIAGNVSMTIGQGGAAASNIYYGSAGASTTLSEVGITVSGGQGGEALAVGGMSQLSGGRGGNGGGGGSSTNTSNQKGNGNNANGATGGAAIFVDDGDVWGTYYGGRGGDGAGVVAGLPAPQGGLGGISSSLSGTAYIRGGQGGGGYGGGGGGGGARAGGIGDPYVIGGLGGNGLTIEGFYLGGKGGDGGSIDTTFDTSITPPTAGEKGGVLIKLVAYPG